MNTRRILIQIYMAFQKSNSVHYKPGLDVMKTTLFVFSDSPKTLKSLLLDKIISIHFSWNLLRQLIPFQKEIDI